MADISLVNGDKIVVCGDSLSYNVGYSSWVDYVHAYLLFRFPTIAFTMEAIARSGLSLGNMLDTSASPTYQVYSKWIAPRQPTHVFSMFADNGSYTKAQYKPLAQTLVDTHIIGVNSATPYLIGMIPQADSDGFAPKGSDYDDANQEISDAGSGFPVYKLFQAVSSVWTQRTTMTADPTTDIITATGHGLTDGTRIICDTASTMPGGLTKETYYYVRDATTDTLKLAATLGGAAIDITSAGSGTRYISANWAKLRESAADEIHPSTAASIIAAWKTIVGLGWGVDVSAATINASSNTVTSATECAISSVASNSYGGINFNRLDNRLPWAIDRSWKTTGWDDAVALFPSIEGWQSYTLTVTGLTAGTYDVLIDGEVVDSVTHTALSTGWNMADLASGPIYDQGQTVLGKIRDIQGIHNTTLVDKVPAAGVALYKSAANNAYETNLYRGPDLITALSAYNASLDTLNSAARTAAQPATRAFELRLQGFSSELPNTRRNQLRKSITTGRLF